MKKFVNILKLIDLKGKEHKIQIKPSNNPVKSEAACRSKLQYLTGQYLRAKYPFDVILEDFKCPDGFDLDFFLPKRKLAYEVQGRQHTEFVPFFHKNEAGFKEHQTRDSNKKRFCEINEITLIYIYTEEDLK